LEEQKRERERWASGGERGRGGQGYKEEKNGKELSDNYEDTKS